MAKSSKEHSPRASLCALGEYLRRQQFFAPLREHVHVPQKTVTYRPADKLVDALLGMLCGAKTLAQSNLTVRVDPALQRAFGRQGCAEQSTIARTLQACETETVPQLAEVSWYYLKRYGLTPQHRFGERRLGVDVDVTPLPIGAKAEGSERSWRGRCRSKTGRKVLRVTASAYREVLHETLLRGKANALPALKAALQEIEERLHWTRERRAQIVLRLDGGFGSTATRNWLLSRGYQLVGKISNSSRVRPLRQHLGPWQPTSSPGRALAMVLHPHRFCRTTRQWMIRTPQEKDPGYQYAVLLTTLPELEPPAVADAYDGRASLEASFCQDKQALGMVTRRQRQWDAPQMVLLLARLAHHLLAWAKRWLSREPITRRRLRGYGLVRLLHEVGTAPGILCWRHGWVVSIRFDPLHPLARVLQRGFAALFRQRVVVRCLR